MPKARQGGKNALPDAGGKLIDSPMKTDQERYPALVNAFRLAIYDALKAEVGEGVYSPNTASLRAAAFKAIGEVLDAETDPVSNRLALNVWQAVMLCNESAFHQGMARAVEQGTLTGIKIAKGAKGKAMGYFE